MTRWLRNTLPVVDAGARPPGGARRETLLWPCWAVPCDIYERTATPRPLDLFEEAVLGLADAGVGTVAEMAALLGLDGELVAFMAHALVGQRLLDEDHRPTATGRVFLQRQVEDEQAVRTTPGYCVVDAITGAVWSRMLTMLEGDDDTSGRRLAPSAAFMTTAPEQSANELQNAVYRARTAAGVFARIERVRPSWTLSEPCFIRTYAYQRALDTREPDVEGWTIDSAACVADPFGVTLRDDQLTAVLRDPEAAWGRAVCEKLAPPHDGTLALLAHRENRRIAQEDLMRRIPHLSAFPDLLDELVTARAMVDLVEPRAAFTSLSTFLHDVFKESLVRRPVGAAAQRFPAGEDAARAHFTAAMEACGLPADVPDGIVQAFQDGRAGSIRSDALRVLLAAAEDEAHPFRALIAADIPHDGPSRWIHDLDTLALRRNVAVHKSGRSLGPASAKTSVDRYVAMAEAAAAYLLEEERS